MHHLNATMPMSQPTRRKFIVSAAGTMLVGACATGGDKIRVVTAGAGEPAILFVHGLSCAGEDWQPQVAALSGKYRCIAPDLPGHGATPVSPRAHSIAGLAEAVTQVKSESGARRVVLVGHSLGGRVIREAYRTAPDRIAGLVFVDSSQQGGNLDEVVARMNAQFVDPGYEALMKRFAEEWFVDDRDPALRARLTARALKLDKQVGKDLLIDTIRWDLTTAKEDMSRIAVPSLIIQSSFYNSQFKRVPIQEGFKTPFMEMGQKEMRNVDLRVVTGVGHFPMLQAADAVNMQLSQFMARVA